MVLVDGSKLLPKSCDDDDDAGIVKGDGEDGVIMDDVDDGVVECDAFNDR